MESVKGGSTSHSKTTTSPRRATAATATSSSSTAVATSSSSTSSSSQAQGSVGEGSGAGDQGAAAAAATATATRFQGKCTLCNFIADFDAVFRHGIEQHQVYICVCCGTHYGYAKELMVHLYREHRVPPQRFASDDEYMQLGGQDTILCCVECSRIFDLGDEVECLEVEQRLDGHECRRTMAMCPLCGERVLTAFVDIHNQTCEAKKKSRGKGENAVTPAPAAADSCGAASVCDEEERETGEEDAGVDNADTSPSKISLPSSSGVMKGRKTAAQIFRNNDEVSVTVVKGQQQQQEVDRHPFGSSPSHSQLESVEDKNKTQSLNASPILNDATTSDKQCDSATTVTPLDSNLKSSETVSDNDKTDIYVDSDHGLREHGSFDDNVLNADIAGRNNEAGDGEMEDESGRVDDSVPLSNDEDEEDEDRLVIAEEPRAVIHSKRRVTSTTPSTAGSSGARTTSARFQQGQSRSLSVRFNKSTHTEPSHSSGMSPVSPTKAALGKSRAILTNGPPRIDRDEGVVISVVTSPSKLWSSSAMPVLDRPRRILKKVTNEDFVFETVSKRRSVQRTTSLQQQITSTTPSAPHQRSSFSRPSLVRANTIGSNPPFLNDQLSVSPVISTSSSVYYSSGKMKREILSTSPFSSKVSSPQDETLISPSSLSVPLPDDENHPSDEEEEDEEEGKVDPLLVEQDPTKRLLLLIDELCEKLSQDWPGPEMYGYTVQEYDDTKHELVLDPPQLDHHLEENSSEDEILSQMLKRTSINCTYCRQVKLIRVDKRQLAIHLFSKHFWTVKKQTVAVVATNNTDEKKISILEDTMQCPSTSISENNTNSNANSPPTPCSPSNTSPVDSSDVRSSETVDENKQSNDNPSAIPVTSDASKSISEIKEEASMSASSNSNEVEQTNSSESMKGKRVETEGENVLVASSISSTIDSDQQSEITPDLLLSQQPQPMVTSDSPMASAPETPTTVKTEAPSDIMSSETQKNDVSNINTTVTVLISWTDFKHSIMKKVFQSRNIVFTYKDPLLPFSSYNFGETPCECLLCGYFVEAQKNLFVHWRKIHRGVAMKCVMCQGRFLFAGALFSHLCLGTPNPIIKNDVDTKVGTPHSSTSKNAPSSTCSSPFSTIADASSFGGEHQVVLDLKDDDGSADTIVLRYQCNICENVQLPGFFNYMVHLRKEHNMCELCLEVLRDQRELEHHMKKHKLNHFCWKCGVTYCAKPNFMTHLFWKHGSESKECSVCLKKKWPHIYHFCDPPEVHMCDTCGFYFTKPKCLVVHRRLHTGEKLRKCPKQNCPEKFISKKLLDKHVENIHNNPSVPWVPPVVSACLSSSLDEHAGEVKVEGEVDSQENVQSKSAKDMEGEEKSVPIHSGLLTDETPKSEQFKKAIEEKEHLGNQPNTSNDETVAPNIASASSPSLSTTREKDSRPPSPGVKVVEESDAERSTTPSNLPTPVPMDEENPFNALCDIVPAPPVAKETAEPSTEESNPVSSDCQSPVKSKKERKRSRKEDPDGFNIEEVHGPNLSEDESSGSSSDSSSLSDDDREDDLNTKFSSHHGFNNGEQNKESKSTDQLPGNVDGGDKGGVLLPSVSQPDRTIEECKKTTATDIVVGVEPKLVYARKSSVPRILDDEPSLPEMTATAPDNLSPKIATLTTTELKPVPSFSALTNGYIEVPAQPIVAAVTYSLTAHQPQLEQKSSPTISLKQIADDLDLSNESSESDTDSDDDDSSLPKAEDDQSPVAMTNLLDRCETLEQSLNQSAMEVDEATSGGKVSDSLKKTTLHLDLNAGMDLLDGVEKLKDTEDFGSMSPLLTPLDDFNFNVPDIPTFEDNSLPPHIVRENALFSIHNEHDYCLRTTMKRGGSSQPLGVATTPAPTLTQPIATGNVHGHSPVKLHKKCSSSPRHKKLKLMKKRRHGSSSSSSSSSSCGSNCSCSSSSSDSSSSDNSSDEEEKQVQRSPVMKPIPRLVVPPSATWQSQTVVENEDGPPVKRGRGRPKGSVNRDKYGIPTAKKHRQQQPPGGGGKRIGRIIVPKPPKPENPDGTPQRRKYRKQKGKFGKKAYSYPSSNEKENIGVPPEEEFPPENFILETDLESDASGSEEVYNKKQMHEVIGKVATFDEIWTIPNEEYLLKIVRGVKDLEELKQLLEQQKQRIRELGKKTAVSRGANYYGYPTATQKYSSNSSPPTLLQTPFTVEVPQMVNYGIKIQNNGSRGHTLKPLIFKRCSTPLDSTRTQPFVRISPLHRNMSTPASFPTLPPLVLGRNRINTSDSVWSYSPKSVPKSEFSENGSYYDVAGGNPLLAPVLKRPKMKFGTGRGGSGKKSKYTDSSFVFKPSSKSMKKTGRDEADVTPVATGAVDEQLYCFCRCPHDNVSQMIGCDSKDCEYQWFHFECVGITIPPKGKWYCPDCKERIKQKRGVRERDGSANGVGAYSTDELYAT